MFLLVQRLLNTLFSITTEPLFELDTQDNWIILSLNLYIYIIRYLLILNSINRMNKSKVLLTLIFCYKYSSEWNDGTSTVIVYDLKLSIKLSMCKKKKHKILLVFNFLNMVCSYKHDIFFCIVINEYYSSVTVKVVNLA